MTPEQRESLGRRMERIGQSVGIRFKWGGKIGRTQDAHRLIHLAGMQSLQLQNDLVELLFRAYHEQERDISDRGELLVLAKEAGLNVTDLDALSAAVDAEEQQYRSRASGVPSFVIHGKTVGADVQDLLDALAS